MIKLGTFNACPDLVAELNKHITTVELGNTTDCDVFFIDFMPTKSEKTTPQKASKLVTQATVLEDAVKRKKPVLLFDRYLALTQKEHDWLKRSNVRFLEPALNNRTGFTYVPFWYVPKTFDDLMLNDVERSILLGYKGNITERVKSFERYYLNPIKLYPDKTVVYDKSIEQVKSDEYAGFNIHHQPFNYTDCKYTFIIGTQREYNIGYLDAFTFKALANNCVPLLASEHKYFAQAFGVPMDLDYLEKRYDLSYIGLLTDCYEGLGRFYPEMKIESVVKQIVSYCK